jgi:hypothetical protein
MTSRLEDSAGPAANDDFACEGEVVASAGDPASAAVPSPFFHADSGSVRFWVRTHDAVVGASISRATLHYRYRPDARNDDPLQTYTAHAREIDAAVRRRVAGGSIEPVMLRESDLPAAPP